MATTEIPFEPAVEVAPSIRVVTLEGVEYGIATRWNARAACWFMDLYSADGVLLVAGEALRNNWPPFDRHRGLEGLPPGSIVPVALWDRDTDAAESDLGGRVRVAYEEAV